MRLTSPFVRWLVAILGASVLLTLSVSFVFLAAWIGRQMAIDACHDRGGEWNAVMRDCEYTGS